MIDTPTPQTDAMFGAYPIMDTQRHGDAVSIEFARNLERQLYAEQSARAEQESTIMALGAKCAGLEQATQERSLRSVVQALEQDSVVEKLQQDLAAARARVSEFTACYVTCPECSGKKGFEDTTYDRTGAWCPCNHCEGHGIVVSARLFRKALAGEGGLVDDEDIHKEARHAFDRQGGYRE